MDEKMLTVNEAAKVLGKSTETVKRYIRDGKLEASKRTDREGYRISQAALNKLATRLVKSNRTVPSPSTFNKQIAGESNEPEIKYYVTECVILAYQAVTLSPPTEEIIGLLSYVGIKRALEILLVIQQSPNKVKNHAAFIRKAISEGWAPETIPIRNQRKVVRNKIDQQDQNKSAATYTGELILYNFLEENN
ncbi:helix-turn-helix domain-containing protein [Priestia abyssalis]|uniref:helix-turn-helix domain-containing protein n=1 Tax=Priestia abyssalis TaxID=1221450 RepID=UPI001475381D|nr:helix-turn-helix domain-containing protein [Priestia abyssalis]